MKKQKMGKVKIRVREAALRLREFTVEQMVKATGFNQESVHSELRRMRDAGLLTIGGRTSSGQRGAPPCLYRIAEDPEIRLTLASEIEDFFSQPEKQNTPTSQHYFTALRLLDQVEAGQGTGTDWESLRKGEEELEFAWHEEGEPKGAVAAYIKCQSGRLQYLKGNYDRAAELLWSAKQLFAELGLPEPPTCAEYLPALLIRQQWEREQVGADLDSQKSLVTKAEAAVKRLREAGTEYLSNHPMSAIFFELSQELIVALKETMRQVVLAEAKNQVSAQPALMPVLRADPIPAGAHAQDTGPLMRKMILPVEPALKTGSLGWGHVSREPYQYAESDKLSSYAASDKLYVAVNTKVQNPGKTLATNATNTGEITGWFEYLK